MRVTVNIGLNNNVTGEFVYNRKFFNFDSWSTDKGNLVRVYSKDGAHMHLSEKVVAAIRIWRYLKRHEYIGNNWSVSFGPYVISKLPKP